MAITRTTTVHRVEVYPEDRMVVIYNDLLDDPDDDQLPLRSQREVSLTRMTSTMAEDGAITETATDVSGHDALVQAIAAAVWTD